MAVLAVLVAVLVAVLLLVLSVLAVREEGGIPWGAGGVLGPWDPGSYI